MEGGQIWKCPNAATAAAGCECKNLAVQKKCIFCRLESHYLGHEISPQVSISDLFQPSTQTKLYHRERLLLTCGVLDSDNSSHVCCGWLMEVNIDNLVMALCGISDIRQLWSRDQRFKEQFSGLEVRLLTYCPLIFYLFDTSNITNIIIIVFLRHNNKIES